MSRRPRQTISARPSDVDRGDYRGESVEEKRHVLRMSSSLHSHITQAARTATKRFGYIQELITSMDERRRHVHADLKISEDLDFKHQDLRSTSLFWSEKVLIVLNTAQYYCLIWSLSQCWAWPYNWLAYSRFMNYFNLDFFAVSENGAGMARSNGPHSVFGEYDNYHVYCLWYAFLPHILYVIFLVGRIPFPTTSMTRWRENTRIRAMMYLVLVFTLLVLHTPVTLAVLRFTVCTSDSKAAPGEWVVTADPNTSCFSGRYYGTTLASVVAWAVYTGALLGVAFGTRADRQAIYPNRLDHERALQLRELEYKLGLGDDWLWGGAAVASSFDRRGLLTHRAAALEKALLVMVYCYARSSKKYQAILMWAVFTFFTVHQVFRRGFGPYRCLSSNVLNLICRAGLLMDYTLGMMTGYGVQSSMLVASNQSIWLFAVNGWATVVAVGWAAFVYVKGDCWPTEKTFVQIFRRNPEAGRWLDAVRRARAAVLEAAAMPPEVVPMLEIEGHMRRLREHWLLAKSRQSILEAMLRECLDEVALAHAARRPRSLLPARSLEAALGAAAPHLARRRAALALAPPRARRILTKLQAVRAFAGGRRPAPLAPAPARPPAAQYAARALAGAPREVVLLAEQTATVLPQAMQAADKLTAAALEPVDQTIRAHRSGFGVDFEDDQGDKEGPAAAMEEEVRGLVHQWKTTIRGWEADFKERHGRRPDKEERQAKRIYYHNYRELRNLLDRLTRADSPPAAAAAAAAENDGLTLVTEKLLSKAATGQTSDALAYKVGKVQKTWKKNDGLTLVTEKLLSKAATGQTSDALAYKVGKVQKTWKKVIKKWEKDFEQQHQRRPGPEDKRRRRSWYANYQEVKDTAQALEAARAAATATGSEEEGEGGEEGPGGAAGVGGRERKRGGPTLEELLSSARGEGSRSPRGGQQGRRGRRGSGTRSDGGSGRRSAWGGGSSVEESAPGSGVESGREGGEREEAARPLLGEIIGLGDEAV